MYALGRFFVFKLKKSVVFGVITSKDNARIKRVVSIVSSAKKRRESGLFVLEGTRLCGEALREDISVCEMFYTASVLESHLDLIKKLEKRAEFSDEVSEAVFSKLSDTCSPQGILLTVSFKSQIKPLDTGRFIAFERVSDPSNLGAAARTAEALGFSGIILSKNGVDPFSPKSLRASMGALLRLPVIYSEDFLKTLEEYKKKGFKISGTVVDSDVMHINKTEFTDNEVAVIGNEANGMTDEAKKVCDRLITIPMAGKAESLNAAAAAAIVMWEMCR